jgi:ectoine hydroxylase-related dioxygenase (phytanoyl-CoA dioxygenase family)
VSKLLGADYVSTQSWIDLPDADVDGYVRKLPGNFDFSLAKRLHDWQSNGIVIFENAVDMGLIHALQDDLEYLKQHHADFELFVELKGVQQDIKKFHRADLDSDGIKFNSIHAISRAACLISLNSEVMAFLQHVFQAEPCALQSLTFYKGSQQPSHIDYPYVRTQTKLARLAASWTPLENIHTDSGPLAYYPGSHKLAVSGIFDWGGGSATFEPDSERTPMDFAVYLDSRMREQGLTPTVFLPKAGDVLVWHGNLVHKGTEIRKPQLTRKSYVTHFTSLDAYPQDFMKKDALANGECVTRNGGYVFFYPWTTHPSKLPSWSALS